MRKLILKTTTIAVTVMLLLPISPISAAEITDIGVPMENIDAMITKNMEVLTPYATTTKDYITTDVVDVRNGPGKDFKKIDSLPKGKKISVKSINNGWAEFIFKERTAYVSEKYLTLK